MMPALPSSWTSAPLQRVGMPSTPKIEPSYFPKETFELYSVPSFAKSAPELVNGAEVGSAKQLVKPNDILLCKIIPHLNRVWVVGSNNGYRQIASSEWIVVRCSDCDGNYLRYFLRSPSFRKSFLKELSGVGGSLVRARPRDVALIPIPIAPRAEQGRIASKLANCLSKVERISDEQKKLPELIKRYKAAILSAAFRGELTKEWRELRELQESADAFYNARRSWAQTQLGRRDIGRDERNATIERDAHLDQSLTICRKEQPLPVSWRWTGMGEVFGVYVGATPSRGEASYWDGDVAWVSSGEVAFCSITETSEKITAAGLANTSTRLHLPGTVLLGMIGEGKTRGQAAILEIEACNNQNCAAIRVSEADYPPDYVFWYLYSIYEQTRSSGDGGNNQPALNKEKVQRIPFPLAPPEEARAIAQVIKARLTPMLNLEMQLKQVGKQLDRLTERLLAKAFMGQLIPQDSSDEPVEELLRRLAVNAGNTPISKRGRPSN
jgi:type I restriction enzyme S subunit